MNAHNPLVLATAAPAVDTFTFDDHVIRVVHIDGAPWFVALDVCAALKLSNPTVSLKALDPDEQAKFNLGGRSGEVLVISEGGMTTLIMRCRNATTKGSKPHRFRRWVTGEVLPSIRRTGSYVAPGAQPATAVGLLEALRDPNQVLALLAHHAQATIEARAELASEQEAHAETHQHLEDTTRLMRIESRRAEETGRALVVAREELAEAAPMIEAFHRFRATGQAENLRTVARILAVDNHPDFFRWLRERKFFFDEGGWIQAKASMLRGRNPLCITRVVTCSDGKERWQTLVTPRGQIWLHDRWEARKRILARQAAEPTERDLFEEGDEG